MTDQTIFCLDTVTNKKAKVTELPFQARCIATGYGWFCAGGDDYGRFAALRIAEGTGSGSAQDRAQQASSREELAYWERYHSSAPPPIRVEKLGSQIVNSISIHKLDFDGPNAGSEIIALLTNNDNSLRMWSLSHDAEMEFDKFDFPMNHASISPDGSLLIVVGDTEDAHLYVRMDVQQPSPGGSRFRWQRLRKMRLHTPDNSHHAEYFTTAWSPNGSLLAVGSQEGFISVFDTALLLDLGLAETPLVTVPTSRPLIVAPRGIRPGAVRAMCFAPEPWDFLVWSESQGRVGISDVRTGLMNRQIVHLDSGDSKVSRCELSNAPYIHPDSAQDFMHDDGLREELLRLTRFEPPTEENSARSALIRDFAAVMAQERRQHGRPQGEGLSEEEWQRLDMLRTVRQRQDHLRFRGSESSSSVVPHSIRYWDQSISRPSDFGPSAARVSRTQSFMNQIRRGTLDQINRDRDSSSSHRRPGDAGLASIRTDPSSGSASTSSDSTEAWRTISAHVGDVLGNEAREEAASFPALMPVNAHDPSSLRSTSTAAGNNIRDLHDRFESSLQRIVDMRSDPPRSETQLRERTAQTRHERPRGFLGAEPSRHHSEYDRSISLSRRSGLRVSDDFSSIEAAWLSCPDLGMATAGVVWDEGRRVVCVFPGGRPRLPH